MKTKEFWWLFVNARTGRYVILPDHYATFEAQEELTDRGFQLVWDSAPDRATGIIYASCYLSVFFASALIFSTFPWQFGTAGSA